MAHPHPPRPTLRLIHGLTFVELFALLLLAFTSTQVAAQRDGAGERVLVLAIPRLETASTTKTDDERSQWERVTVRPGDTLYDIFQRLGLGAGEVQAVLDAGRAARRLARLVPGDELEILRRDGRLQALVHRPDQRRSLQVNRREDGRFHAQLTELPVDTWLASASATIRTSLFEAAQEAGLSDRLTMELAEIFGWDIDFALDIREGDRFSVLYEEFYRDGQYLGEGNIVAAEFTNQGKTYRAVRYTTPDGRTDYYTPEGRSVRRAFLRTPVQFTRISSRFGRRFHPVLNRMRVHKGVDYAAPRGTPVRAAGDGKIVFRGRKGGYGKTVIIQHGQRYSTLYAHLNGYARGIRAGRRVRQGQIIAYVGSTGLTTGPHLHYEFRVDGVHRNPLTVRLPQAKPLKKAYLDDFRRAATGLLAQLRLATTPMMAANDL